MISCVIIIRYHIATLALLADISTHQALTCQVVPSPVVLPAGCGNVSLNSLKTDGWSNFTKTPVVPVEEWRHVVHHCHDVGDDNVIVVGSF